PRLFGKRHRATRPVPDHRLRRRRRSDENRSRKRPCHARRPQDRHLRRTRRRPGQRQILPQDRAELRELLAVPRADCKTRGSAGGTGEVIHRRQWRTFEPAYPGSMRMEEQRPIDPQLDTNFLIRLEKGEPEFVTYARAKQSVGLSYCQIVADEFT